MMGNLGTGAGGTGRHVVLDEGSDSQPGIVAVDEL
jgi:hypothetical protein